jgi:hypothetical protein
MLTRTFPSSSLNLFRFITGAMRTHVHSGVVGVSASSPLDQWINGLWFARGTEAEKGITISPDGMQQRVACCPRDFIENSDFFLYVMLCHSYSFCHSLKWTHARATVDYMKEKTLRRIKTSSLFERFTRHVVDVKSSRRRSRAVFCLLLNHQYQEHTAIRKRSRRWLKTYVLSRQTRVV